MAAKLALICISLLLVFASALQKNEFSRFPAVETYEADDGILIMPKHSDAGDVCSVVLERRHVSSQGVDLDAKMSREEIRRIFDELAPRSERGQSKLNLGESGDITTYDGPTLETTATYENVSLQMYGKNKHEATPSYVAAIIQWKKGHCSHTYPVGSGG